MATADSVKANLQSIITKSNNTTGRNDTNVGSAVDALIAGFGKGGGITPTGTKTITTNGEHDVTNFAKANVNVPVGVTPTGTKEITANGTHDVTNYANAAVNVPTGMNAKVFTATVASDVTRGNYKILPANDFLASIRSNPNAFVIMVPLNQQASTAMFSFWAVANFVLMYTGANARKALVVRTTASANNILGYGGGMTGTNSNGNLNVASDGSLTINGCNTTYPVKAGSYLIIGGIAEML